MFSPKLDQGWTKFKGIHHDEWAPISGDGHMSGDLVGSIVPKQEGGQTPGSALGETPSFSSLQLGFAESRLGFALSFRVARLATLRLRVEAAV